jgi:hypothetical protein
MDNPGSAPGGSSVKAVLVGGPTDIPERFRKCQVNPTDQKIKIPHYGGYEHFERVHDPAGHTPCEKAVIFRWTMRTKMAE